MTPDPYEDMEWRQFIAQQDRWDRRIGIALFFVALATAIILVAEHWPAIQSFLPN